MNPLVTFRYPVKEIEFTPSIKHERGTLLADILFSMAHDERLTSMVSLDFIEKFRERQPTPSRPLAPKGPPLTQESFPVVQKRILELAIEILKKKIPSLASVPDDVLATYLLQKGDVEGAAATIKKKVSGKEERELIGVAASAISSIFAISLFKECGAQYGLDPDKSLFVARPYSAPNAPKKTMFKDSYEQAVYTIQQTMYYGVPKEAAATMLKKIRTSIKEDLRVGILLADTEGYRQLQRVLGTERAAKVHILEELSDEQIVTFQEAIGRNEEFMVKYLNEFVFSQIKVYTRSIATTPQTLAGTSKVVGGYTGTLHEGILPKRTSGFPEIGTDGKTIRAVTEKIDKRQAEIFTFHEAQSPLLDQVIGPFAQRKSEYTVFIDSGGWLKEKKVQDFARDLLEQCRKAGRPLKGIVFHNPEGKIVALEVDARGKISDIPVPVISYGDKTQNGSYLTIITEDHEEGTNIPQTPTAKALISIRKDMLERSLLQSVFRMRQILSRQSASLVVNDEVREHILSQETAGLELVLGTEKEKDLPEDIQKFLSEISKRNPQITNKELLKKFKAEFPINIRAIWRYTVANEALAEQKKNWVAAQQKMREIVEKPIRMVLCDVLLPAEDRNELFSKLQDIFVETDSDLPFERFSVGLQAVEGKEAIKREIEKYSRFVATLKDLPKNSAARSALRKITELYPESIENELATVVDAKDIPLFIELHRAGESSEMEQEAEAEAEAEAQAELQAQLLLETEEIPPELTPAPFQPLPAASELLALLSKDTPIDGVEDLRELGVSSSMVPIPGIEKLHYSINAFPESLADFRNPPGRFLLLVKVQDKTQYIILSHKDAGKIKDEIAALDKETQKKGSLTLMTLDGREVISSDENALKVLREEEKAELKNVRILTKLLTGKAHFSGEEMDQLEQMVKNQILKPEHVNRLKNIYEVVLRCKPAAARVYKAKNHIQQFFAFHAKGIPPARESYILAFLPSWEIPGVDEKTNFFDLDITKTGEDLTQTGTASSALQLVQNKLRELMAMPLPNSREKAYKSFVSWITKEDLDKNVQRWFGLNKDNPSYSKNLRRIQTDAKKWIEDNWFKIPKIFTPVKEEPVTEKVEEPPYNPESPDKEDRPDYRLNVPVKQRPKEAEPFSDTESESKIEPKSDSGYESGPEYRR